MTSYIDYYIAQALCYSEQTNSAKKSRDIVVGF